MTHAFYDLVLSPFLILSDKRKSVEKKSNPSLKQKNPSKNYQKRFLSQDSTKLSNSDRTVQPIDVNSSIYKGI